MQVNTDDSKSVAVHHTPPVAAAIDRGFQVLIVTRSAVGSIPTEGERYPGTFCVNCSTQIARLISHYQEFVKLGAEVVVVFPIAFEKDRSEMDAFAEQVQGTGKKVADAPFPITAGRFDSPFVILVGQGKARLGDMEIIELVHAAGQK